MYFDRQALIACWREALLAQAVLADRTRGYHHHPQLERFRQHRSPAQAIGAYLRGIADGADARGYRFDRTKILEPSGAVEPIGVTSGQMAFEWAHLQAKLAVRSPAVAALWRDHSELEPHPLFNLIDGPIATWERPHEDAARPLPPT